MSPAHACRAAFALALVVGAARAGHAGDFPESGYGPELMAAWATDATIVRGPQDVAQPGLGPATHGTEADALGAPTGSSTAVVSLGDGGSATLFFDSGIGNGAGDDFAVFENGFWGGANPDSFFGEFAFVEVSSNGVDFARFDAISQRATPVSGGGTVDPTDYHNFGGKHALGSGTGFDLDDLLGHPLVTGGLVDLDAIDAVRLVDVIGDGSLGDSLAAPVYDPYATPFATSGFDVDAVGVLHVAPEPGRVALLGSGGLALAGLARRRRRPARSCDAR